MERNEDDLNSNMTNVVDLKGCLKYFEEIVQKIAETEPELMRRNDTISNNESFGETLNYCLKTTDICDLITKEGDEQCDKVKNIVNKIQWNIVALCHNNLFPLSFGTGLLIRSNILITARHCIEGEDIRSLVVRIGYQMNKDFYASDNKDGSSSDVNEVDTVNVEDNNVGNLNFGKCVKIKGIIEENGFQDYVILLLEKEIEEFQTIQFDTTETNVYDSVIFLHHPYGGPKKVSVNETKGNSNVAIAYSGFQDSYKGSSGGVYVLSTGNIFAIHVLNFQNSTHGLLLSEIVKESKIFNKIITTNEEITSVVEIFVLPEYEGQYDLNQYLEVLRKKPDNFPLLRNELREQNNQKKLANHHIISIGRLEFLWMLKFEYEPLNNVLKKLSFQSNDSANSISKLIVNNLIWAPWNIFVGPDPTLRCDDMGDVGMEKCPLSFDINLWNSIKNVYDDIELCWNKRCQITQINRKKHIKLIDKNGDYAVELKECIAEELKIKKNKNLNSEYRTNLIKLLTSLRQLVEYNNRRKVNYIHWTNDTDWTQDGGKYRLRKTFNDGEPVENLMMKNDNSLNNK
mmetsp:Transcript_20575/g.18725  ORF Transcript_20575/g.18725 Transcript_20575/m.18725 type:complete len:571 (-) Transcript_20575:72-1784(-)